MPGRSKDPLRQYLEWLQQRFDDPGIPDEKTLSLTVEIPVFDPKDFQPLLQSLGYDSKSVEANHPIQAGAGKVYADFLVGQDPDTWVLELKSPYEDCGNPKFIDQLQDYMQRCKSPIGVLFNGHHAAVHVNPEHKALKLFADRAKELKERPVNQTKHADDLGELLSLFSPFRRKTGMPDTSRLARKLAKALPPPSKTGEIRGALERLLREPTAEVASALVSVRELADLGATPDIVLEVWPSGPPPTPLNPEVRRLVAEVCGKLGYDTLVQRKVKGLKMRTDGQQTGGFRLVRDLGAPDGLTVQGVDSQAAERIIRELERLLAQPQG